MAEPTGVSTKGITLSSKVGTGTLTELEGLLEVPEIGGTPEQIDVTTLKDSVRRYIPGVRDMGDLTFTFLYDNSSATSNFRILKGYQKNEDVVDFSLAYPDGTIHAFQAKVTVNMGASAVNGALQFTAILSLQSDIDITDPVAG